jgi:signal transduction histidine kinase
LFTNPLSLAARLLQPASASEAALRIDLIRSINANVRPPATLLFGLLFGSFALHWVAWPQAALWAAVIAGYPIATIPLRRKVFGANYGNERAGEFHAKALLIMMPLHLVWVAYVPMCWIAGDPFNNSFLMIFLLAGLLSSIQIYGPCIYLSLPAMLIYLPVISTHFLRTGSTLDPFLPVMQILFCVLLTTVALRHFRTFRESVARRLTIEALVRDLESARDAALAANHAKSSFLANMSHELRTPLNAIIGFSKIISDGMLGPVSPPKYGQYADDIHDSGIHLLALINDLLDLSKIEAGNRELEETPIALEPLFDELCEQAKQQADSAGVSIARETPAGIRLIADDRAVRQILQNFLSNAVKYSPAGGRVLLFARFGEDGALRIGVEDHGAGMDEKSLRTALQPYSQLSHMTAVEGRGTGLGLPLARALIELHGAAFHIESAPNAGTRVWGTFGRERIETKIAAAA